MISSRIGHALDRPLTPLAKKLNINPNYLTVSGFILTAIAGFAISRNTVVGAVLVLIASLFDVLDGIVARVNGRATRFGAFLDSVLDRFSDAFLFLGLAWYLKEDLIGVFLSIGSFLGAFGVSYARARAEGLGIGCKTGLMERSERVGLLIVICFTGYLIEGLWLMLVLTYITVFQRIYYVRDELKKTGHGG